MIDTDMTLPLDARHLIPHKWPSCMIDRLVAYDNKTGVVESLVTADNPLIDDSGRLDPVAYIEIIAQAYAAVKGYDDVLHNKPIKKGFLVIVKRIDFSGEASLGDLLTVKVTTTSEVAGFAIADGVISCNDKVIASGNLTLFIP